MNATIMPVEVRDQLRTKSPAPISDALFEFAYVYGAVPREVDLVRVGTNLGDQFEGEVLRPEGSQHAFFVVAIPSAKAPLEMQIGKVEFGRRDKVDVAGDVIWSESLVYLTTNR